MPRVARPTAPRRSLSRSRLSGHVPNRRRTCRPIHRRCSPRTRRLRAPFRHVPLLPESPETWRRSCRKRYRRAGRNGCRPGRRRRTAGHAPASRRSSHRYAGPKEWPGSENRRCAGFDRVHIDQSAEALCPGLRDRPGQIGRRRRTGLACRQQQYRHAALHRYPKAFEGIGGELQWRPQNSWTD